MKKFLYLIVLLGFTLSNAQKEAPAINKELEFDTYFRIQTYYPIHFGNTALAKAHKPRPGFSVQMNVLDYQNFKAGFGFDFTTYEITDKEVIANLSTSKYTSAYLLMSYEYNVSRKIQITPNIGYGSASLELGSRSSRFGKQGGNEFRIGTFIDYKIGKATYAFAGIHYVSNRFNVRTSPEYEAFFSKANQLQLNLGIRFGN